MPQDFRSVNRLKDSKEFENEDSSHDQEGTSEDDSESVLSSEDNNLSAK